MNPKYEKLKTLLKELLQLDQPDLDFGLYRIMHAKSAEVTQFLDHDLLPQVRAELAEHESAELIAAKQALAERVGLRRKLSDDPDQDEEVARLKQKIAEAGVPAEQLEAEVYDHLFGFFRRYYSEGDFLSKRVYKPGVYAIPYEGEEVKLHWANADQYYIKTSEYLRDYAFRLRPDDESDPLRVHFQLVDAAEGEHGNVKPAQGKDRVFILAAGGGTARSPFPTGGFMADVLNTVKPTGLIRRAIQIGTKADQGDVVLDFFAGSGTTGHAVIKHNFEDGGNRRFILVEAADYFNQMTKQRIVRALYAPEWKDGKPVNGKRGSGIVKYLRLESYEDALNNLAQPRRTAAQQRLLDTQEAQGAGGIKEQYMLRYLLDVETRGSQSLLNVKDFVDPTAYKLRVKRPGSDESRDVNVDLLETFNWLIGLAVRHIAAPREFTAEFERDREGRLRVKGRLREVEAESDAGRPHPGPLPEGEGEIARTFAERKATMGSKMRPWFRTVTGTTPEGKKTLIIWRKRPGGDTAEGIEQDNLVLDEWFTRQGYSSKDSEFELIYVNGTNNLENLKTADDTWKVRVIEEDFHRLMFSGED